MLEHLSGNNSNSLKTELCIIGAGPAGIVLALTLAELGISSVLLEGGMLDSPLELTEDPYEGLATGVPYPLSGSRLRYFGGTSNHWGGWCKPLDEIDFTQRPSAKLPSWPITLDDLKPHYERAVKWCEIPGSDFDATSILGPANKSTFPVESVFNTKIFRFSPPTRFGIRYRDDVARSEKIQCFYDATLCKLEYSGQAITRAIACSSDRTELKVDADQFVLAMGGIENARFLLHFNKKNGSDLGANSGLLGQCFMDHFGFHPGYLAASSDLELFRHESEQGDIMPVVTALPELQNELDLPSICVMAKPDAPDEEIPPAYFENPGLLDRVQGMVTRYRLQLLCEPTANTLSRITLSNEKDFYGIERVQLNWHIEEDDYVQVEQFMHYFANAVGRSGVGRVQRTRWFEGEVRTRLSPGMHHMGTTRMSEEPGFGVVNPDCKVFGSENLFVAGSSVFPRVGYSNPTLTLVALADRLAQHLHADNS